MGLIADLGTGPVGVDTAVFIYFIEAQPAFLSAIDTMFKAADAGRLEVVTSALTLMEVLVVPYRAGDRALADRYDALLTRSRGVRSRKAALGRALAKRFPDQDRLVETLDRLLAEKRIVEKVPGQLMR